MKTRCVILAGVLALAALLGQAQTPKFNPGVTLWYETEVTDWRDALPMGNGRLGAMYFGGVKEDRLQFNEDTYWTGGPYDSVPKGASQHLAKVRELLFADRLVEGHLWFGRHFLGYPVEQQKYQSMGNVVLSFASGEGISHYRRSLDLSTGISRISYEQAGVKVTDQQNRLIAVSPGGNGTWSFATAAGETYQVVLTE